MQAGFLLELLGGARVRLFGEEGTLGGVERATEVGDMSWFFANLISTRRPHLTPIRPTRQRAPRLLLHRPRLHPLMPPHHSSIRLLDKYFLFTLLRPIFILSYRRPQLPNFRCLHFVIRIRE